MLLHPVGLDLTYWGSQIAALNNDYDVIACDLPGHGSSAGAPVDWTLPRAADIVGAFVRTLDADNVHLVGLSMGGMLAQALALAQPDLVRSLILIDTAASFSDEGRSGMRARATAARAHGMSEVLPSTITRWFMPETVASRPDLVDRVSKTLLADDASVHAAIWDMIAGLDLVADLDRIHCPELVLVGEHDLSSPISAAKELRGHIDGAHLVVVPNAAHLSPLEKPDMTNGEIARFLARAY